MKKIIRLTESDLMRLVKRVIKEQNDSDEDFFYKARPNQSYYYDKDDNVSDVEDEMDVEEWDGDDFDNFHNKYPYGERQRTFPNTEDGKRWFKGYSREHGGKFPVFKRKR